MNGIMNKHRASLFLVGTITAADISNKSLLTFILRLACLALLRSSSPHCFVLEDFNFYLGHEEVDTIRFITDSSRILARFSMSLAQWICVSQTLCKVFAKSSCAHNVESSSADSMTTFKHTFLSWRLLETDTSYAWISRDWGYQI